MSSDQLDDIGSVLSAATAQSQEAGAISSALELGVSGVTVPSVEDYLQMGVEELNAPPPAQKKKRGRPKGSGSGRSSRSQSPAPDQGMSGEELTRQYVRSMGDQQMENPRAVYLRKKIHKIFDYFPHKVDKYYPNRPAVAFMNVQQLIETEQLLINILDEGDESMYVKEAVKIAAGAIETVGPVVHRRWLKWLPGAEFLNYQRGLREAVTELMDEPGDDGLADEVNRISLEFIGWAPTNPYVSLGMKLYRVMNVVKDETISEMSAEPLDKGDPSNPINDI